MKTRISMMLAALCVAVSMAAQGAAEMYSKDRKVGPGNKVAMKLYKEAMKKEKKNPSYSLSVFESLANDGYAPAQYKLYELGKGHEWLEKAALGGQFAATDPMYSQLLKQCDQVIDRCRSCMTRASNGDFVSAKEIQMLADDHWKVLSPAVKQMIMMMRNLSEAAAARDANYFPPAYKGKKGILKAVDEFMALERVCHDRYNGQLDEYERLMEEILKYQKK